MNFDVISWVKNGAWVLPTTLKRLDEVLPSEFVHRKIMVDDHSSDNTKEVGEAFGWEVYDNPDYGISSGANFGLSLVDCPFFMAFEQDLLLAKDWWTRIAPLFDNPDVSAASGVRFSTAPKAIRDLEMFSHREYLVEKNFHHGLSDRKLSVFASGKTLDNTLFRTDAVRKVGGFPYRKISSGVDTVLLFVLDFHGFNWVVDPFCVSEHIKVGFRQELSHQRWYARGSAETRRLICSQGYDPEGRLDNNYGFRKTVKRFIVSPFEGAFLMYKTGNPMLFLFHPLSKLLWFVGYIEGKKLTE
jgi:hypothetical protein